jgi:hypothetical protein
LWGAAKWIEESQNKGRSTYDDFETVYKMTQGSIKFDKLWGKILFLSFGESNMDFSLYCRANPDVDVEKILTSLADGS